MKTRTLILGGGVGGVYTALELDKTIASRPEVEVTLVSRENAICFTLMLHEVAATDIDIPHIVNPFAKCSACLHHEIHRQRHPNPQPSH